MAGVVDAITGQPLLREEDLSLPFGRGTWRMIRTYGGNATGYENEFRDPMAKYWDWAGVGWMMSENPVLLFDAKYIQHEPTLPRRCYLILDAHHSIPFTQDEEHGTYAAPAWFDAELTAGGNGVHWGVASGSSQKQWVDTANNPVACPPKVWIKLYSGSVTYQFNIEPTGMVPMYGAGTPTLDAHANPLIEDASDGKRVRTPGEVTPSGVARGGLGIPYLATLGSITDQYGNTAEIERVPFHASAVDPDAGCQSCRQNCTEKGQIQTVTLRRSDQSVAWTLLYVHRSFRAWMPELASSPCDEYHVPTMLSTIDSESKWFMQNAVHTVFVYKGAINWGGGRLPTPGRWTLPADAFVRIGAGTALSLEEQQASHWSEDRIAQHLEWDVPDDWQYQLRYTYDETILPMQCHQQQGSIPQTAFGPADVATTPTIFACGTPMPVVGGYVQGRLMPHLLSVELRTREPAAASQVTSSRTAYVYDSPLLDRVQMWMNPPVNGGGNAPSVWAAETSGSTGDYSISTPRIRHILRNERVRDANIKSGQQGELAIFKSAFEEHAPNLKNYAQYANLSLDWKGVDHQILGNTTTVYNSPWIQQLFQQCVLSQVERGRLNHMDRSNAAVSRVRINEGGSADGVYDLMFLRVDPANAPFPTEGSWDSHNFAAGLRLDETVRSDTLIPHVYRFPATYTLFPFSWRRFASESEDEATAVINETQGVLPATPMDQPVVITMVDRHDGTCAGSSRRELKRPYLLRNLFTAAVLGDDEANLPHQREVVGLNAAGFVLFDRNWDYQNGGANATGATEQYIYEATTTQVPGADGIPDAGGGDVTRSIVTGMRLIEHRSLGWGVAYARGVQGAGCNPAGTDEMKHRGLITKFDYFDHSSTDPQPGKQTAFVNRVSVQEGTEGPLMRLSEVEYRVATDQPEHEVRVLLDATGAEKEVMHASRHLEYYDSENTKPKWETNWQAAARSWPQGPLMTPFETKVWSDRGMLIGRIYGLCGTVSAEGVPEAGSAAQALAQRVSVDVYGYNRDGQKSVEIIDAALDSSGAPSPWSTHYRTSWDKVVVGDYSPLPSTDEMESAVRALTRVATFAVRHVPSGEESHLPPLNRVTGYGYDGLGALQVVAKPGGRFDFYMMHCVLLPSSVDTTGMGRMQLSTVYFDGTFQGGSQTLSFGRAGQFATLVDGRPVRTWSVEWAPRPLSVYLVPLLIPNETPADLGYRTPILPLSYFQTSSPLGDRTLVASLEDSVTKWIAEVRPDYDAVGRPTEVKAKGNANDGVTATDELLRKASYTDFGLVARREEPSGTIYRTVTNPFGQLIAEFKGTDDSGSCWQNGTDEGNMALTARHVYGDDINNIRQPVLTRRYREMVTCSDTDFQGRGGTPMLSDKRGWEEATGYDRRGRKCVEEVYGPAVADMPHGGPRPSGVGAAAGCMAGEADVPVGVTTANVLLRAEYTWYDHQDRVRFRATFDGAAAEALRGATSPDSVNPRARDVYTRPEPTALDILATHPARLSETIYNERGAVEEEREYDAGNPSTDINDHLRYQATRMYYDHAGRVTARVSAGGRWERMSYDALGRLATTSVLRGDVGAAAGATADENRYEVETTENEYNENGQLERTSHLVRVVLGTAGVLTNDNLHAGPGGNAVRTDTLTWYDADGRAVATASLGTGCGATPNRPQGMFCNTTTDAPVGPSRSSVYGTAPAWNPAGGGSWTWDGFAVYPNAQISTTKYDNVGRVRETRAANGSSTTRDYDGLNRVVRESVKGSDGARVTATAYKYRGEKLWKMAAIRPGNLAFDESRAIEPDFTQEHDGTLQVTKLVYNETIEEQVRKAAIVDEAGVPITEDCDLLYGIRFPRGANCGCDFNHTGTTEVQDIFDFLNAWFAGCDGVVNGVCRSGCLQPYPNGAQGTFCQNADFNHRDGLTIQDIFDFLTCWFNEGACGHQWNIASNGEVDIRFDYTLDGLVHSRSDLSHMDPLPGLAETPTKVVFEYDVLGRRMDMSVAQGGVDVADSIEHVAYTYDVLDRLTKVRADARDREHGGCLYPVATSTFTHDSWGNLTTEQLVHGSVNPSVVASLKYQWEYSAPALAPPGAAPVVARLKRMTQPWSAGWDGSSAEHRGAVTLGYGDTFAAGNAASPAAWLDNLMHRVQTMTFNPGVSSTNEPVGTPVPVASYMYAGAGMRLAVRCGPQSGGPQSYAVLQDFSDGTLPSGSGPGLPGLDAFGRVSDLHYKTGSSYTTGIGPTVARRQLSYDRAGNLTRELVTQQAIAGVTTGADRSWSYGYDKVGRLLNAATGTFNANWASLTGAGSGNGVAPLTYTPFELKRMDEQWGLDDLGNWRIAANTSGDATQGLRTREFDAGGGLTQDGRRGHRTDDRNQIGTGMMQQITGDVPDEHAKEVKYAYDAAGRMRYDGRVLYEHDSFGRLVQARGAPSGVTVNPDGTMVAVPGYQIQALVVHYSYDGLGRVIRVQRPANGDSTAPASGGKLCITDLYYDGVRVVQEVGWGGNAAAGGGAGVPFRVNRNQGGVLDGSLPGLPRRANEVQGSDVLISSCPGGTDNPGGWNWADRRLEREYIWAADSGAYVDENVAQLVYTAAHEPAAGSSVGQAAYKGDDTSATILYTLADHNANVIGLTDALGRLVAQYSYTPYGEVRAAEYFTPPDVGSLTSAETMAAARGNHLGHQGLRMERFDRPWDGAMDIATASLPSATSAYRAVCHNRNRMYDPAEGRFLEQDPNGLGICSNALTYGGAGLGNPSVQQSVLEYFGNGTNTHIAYICNPVNNQDATGCFSTAWMAPLAPGIAGAIVGAAINSMLELMSNQNWSAGSIAGAAGRGAAVGFVAGQAGAAFAASFAGLFAAAPGLTSVASSMVAGFAGGVTDSALRGRSNREQLHDGMYGALLGGALGGASYQLSRTVQAADDAVLAQMLRTSTREVIDDCVNRAFRNTELGPEFGTRVHSELAKLVRGLGRSDLTSEVSYLNGRIVSYGTKGSVRIDVVEGNPLSPSKLYDLKTGFAKLSTNRIADIRKHVPGAWTIDELQ